MEEKEKGWAAGALQKCSRNDFVSKNFVFNSQSGYIFTIFNKLFHFWLINIRLAGTGQTFLPCLCVVGEDFVVLTRTNHCDPSDDTRGLFARNFRLLSSLELLFPLCEIILFLVHFGHFKPLVGWISLEKPHLLPFLSHRSSWRCLWRRGQKVLNFFEAFSHLENRKSCGLVTFWNCFCTQKLHNTSYSFILLSKHVPLLCLYSPEPRPDALK